MTVFQSVWLLQHRRQLNRKSQNTIPAGHRYLSNNIDDKAVEQNPNADKRPCSIYSHRDQVK